MNPKIIYPIPKRQSNLYNYIRNYSRIIFIVTSLICVIINILTKTKPWSLVVIWSLFAIWRLVFSFKLVEFSIFSHAIRACLYIVILLGIIDAYLAPGWAQTVIPIVVFSTFFIMLILFYAIYDRKEKHMASILLLGILSIISIPYSIHSLPVENWVAFGFNVATICLLIILIILNRKEIAYEIKARLNIKQ